MTDPSMGDGKELGTGERLVPWTSAAQVMTQDIDAALLQRVEDSSLNASAPPQQRWLDGWIVRYSPGKAKRARCINAVALGQRSPQAKLTECEALFREASLPLVVRITPFTQPAGLDAELARQGWPMFDDTRVMVLAELRGWSPPPAAVCEDGPAEAGKRVQSGLPAGWAEAIESAHDYAHTVGRLRDSTALEIESHAQRLQLSPVPYTGLVWRNGAGQVQACGQFARESGLVGLYDIFTAPAARGRGLARALCARLLRLAREEGAHTAYLQVDAANTSARRVYVHLGFQDAYTYHYRSSESGAH